MPVPRIIHQLWIGNQDIRPRRLMQTWKDKNPSCEYILWTENYLSKFGFINQNKIDEMKDLNGKCDIMRYEILYRYGGIFMDADSECLNTLDDFFFDTVDRWSCYENEQVGKDIETGITLISEANMGYAVGDGFCRECILELAKTDVIGRHGWEVTGNRFLATMIEKYREIYPFKIYPSWYFIPKHGTGVQYQGTDKIYANHLWGSTFQRYGTSELS